MATQIKRDSFGRATLIREVNKDGGACAWCNQTGRFLYYWDQDRIYAQPRPRDLRPFCSVGCYRAYME